MLNPKFAISILIISILLVSFSTIFLIKPAAAETSGIKVDNSRYSVYVGHPAQVKITGKIDGAAGGNVMLTIIKPDGKSEEDMALVTRTGDFTSLILLDKNSQLGHYQISAHYNGAYVGSVSFDVTGKESQQAITSQTATQSKTYQNTQYGFSIKHPTWWQEQEVSQKTSQGDLILVLSPSKSTFLVVAFAPNDKNFGSLQGQDYLNKMIENQKKDCTSSCSNFKVSESNTYTHKNGYLEYVVVYSSSLKATDGTTSDVVRIIAQIPNGKDTWLLLIQTTADELKQHLDEISSVTSTFTILDYQKSTTTGTAAKDYSNYSLLKGEWVKHKFYLKTESNVKSLQQSLQNIMQQQFSGFAGGQQLKSFDDLDWMKTSVTSVSKDEIKLHGESQVLGKQNDLGDQSLGQSTFFAVPRNTKVGDSFDSLFSTPDNPSKITVTGVKKANILGKSVKVFELKSHQTEPLGEMTKDTDQVAHYDTKTGMILDWGINMKIYNSTTHVNVQFGMTPVDWSQLSTLSEASSIILAKASQKNDIVYLAIKNPNDSSDDIYSIKLTNVNGKIANFVKVKDWTPWRTGANSVIYQSTSSPLSSSNIIKIILKVDGKNTEIKWEVFSKDQKSLGVGTVKT